MRNHLSWRLFFLLVGICLFPSASKSVSAQSCGSGSFVSWAASKTRDVQGLIQVTVKYSGGDHTPSEAVVNAAKSAVAEWNALKCSTGVQFTETSGSATLEFYYDPEENPDLTAGCAQYRSIVTRVYHGPNFASRLAELGSTQAKGVFVHELGHFLGLGHTTSPSTVMNQVSTA